MPHRRRCIRKGKSRIVPMLQRTREHHTIERGVAVQPLSHSVSILENDTIREPVRTVRLIHTFVLDECHVEHTRNHQTVLLTQKGIDVHEFRTIDLRTGFNLQIHSTFFFVLVDASITGKFGCRVIGRMRSGGRGCRGRRRRGRRGRRW